MDDLERTFTETLQRVNQFGIENAAAVTGSAKAVGCFATIQTSLDEIDARGILRASADSAKLSATEQRALKRRNLRTMLTGIAKTARDIARADEAFVNKFRLPRNDRSDLKMLETARAFAVDLVPVKALFAAYGFDENFIDRLTSETDRFESAMDAQNASLRRRVDSNASIESILDNALDALRTLKIIIPNIFSGDPGKLADWASASHVENAVGKRKPSNSPVSA